ncbi:4'-phosphopantetheinyl transferase [Kitasatospora sp. MAP12-15]|uniref:4'-phosphopantetheinyl transferase family protein n=1 Tax=unclassified Kitasatospora TaxID=2633591 RepID=UPI002474CD41|nr:4'-phosphopantetheinyl transferase superfamily protein [Kitasatospora sp. MAP12-44]MDH6111056.1 4'-phosphopantetheinyl transferase [Kitasatospora sp. MAP12-44]
MSQTLSAAADGPSDLLADRADVWLLPEDSVDAFAAALGGLAALTDQERQRHDRLISPASRRRFLGARLLARRVLSEYADVPPEGWRFNTGTYGRPEIEGADWGLDFNITHTNGLIAAIVVRDLRCGVDVEQTPARPEAVKLAPKVLTHLETEVLARHTDTQRGLAFADSWVAKEAYTKATGMGMCRGFDAFSVHLLRDGSFALVDDEIPAEERPLWQVEVLQVWDRFALGVAIRHTEAQPGPVPVRLRSAMAELLPAGSSGPGQSGS